MDNIVFSTVQELAMVIRQRQISAAEVLEAYLAQIARHNPALNAIVTLDEERARARAKEADTLLARGEIWGPLHGVPITIKDAIECFLNSPVVIKGMKGYVPGLFDPLNFQYNRL